MYLRNFLLAAFIVHVLAAWFSIGRFHADEQFQILEFGAYKAGYNSASSLPWEFHEKIRPGIQPALVYSVIKIGETMGAGPFMQAFILRLFAAMLALYASWKILSYYRNKLSDSSFKALAFLSLFWCYIPWFHARFSSENISASLFFIGMFSYLSISKDSRTLLNVIVCGLLCGLAGVVRFQLNFFLFGFFLWMIFIEREKLTKTALFAGGIIAANTAGILFDKWFYGSWEITGWNYVYQNIFLHKAEQFGKEPAWYFLEKTLTDAFPPFSILILISFIWIIIRRPKAILTWISVPFILAHLASAHKELRFLFPMIPLVPVFAILTYEDIMFSGKFNSFAKMMKRKAARIIRSVFIAANFLFLAYLTFKPADDYTPTLKFLYKNYDGISTTMLCENREINPYNDAAALNFYRTSSIQTVIISETEPEISPSPLNKFIYVSGKNNLEKFKNFKLKKVYSSIPDFMNSFNFNNWIDRVNKVYIYELESTE